MLPHQKVVPGPVQAQTLSFPLSLCSSSVDDCTEFTMIEIGGYFPHYHLPLEHKLQQVVSEYLPLFWVCSPLSNA